MSSCQVCCQEIARSWILTGCGCLGDAPSGVIRCSVSSFNPVHLRVQKGKKTGRPERKLRGWVGRLVADSPIYLSVISKRLLPHRQSPKKRPGSPSRTGRVHGCGVLRSAAALRVPRPSSCGTTGNYRPAPGAGPGGLAKLVGLLGGQGREGVPGLGRNGRGRPRQLWRPPHGGRATKPAAYEGQAGQGLRGSR